LLGLTIFSIRRQDLASPPTSWTSPVPPHGMQRPFPLQTAHSKRTPSQRSTMPVPLQLEHCSAVGQQPLDLKVVENATQIRPRRARA